MTFRSILFLLLIAISHIGFSQKSGYQYTLDLTVVKDDRVKVEVILPPVNADKITFFLPKIVPGTYAIADYGRFVHDFQAFDASGKSLVVKQAEVNGWTIEGAKKLHKITYWVEDTYDTEVGEPEIFQPAGTNIEEGKNYLINTGGFFGYLEGMKQLPFNIQVLKPEGFYGSTGMLTKPALNKGAALKKEKNKKSKVPAPLADVYETSNYDQLVDSPLMYAKADTAIIKVGNTEVLIGSYSPNKKVNAREIASRLEEVLKAQQRFLGGTLPVNKYAFIFYFTDQPVQSYGALEHSYSSLYYMPEETIENMEQQLRDFAAHEFFHIVTPLTIHSEEIQYFDFNSPKMSRHLWLYEGVTEYFAGNVQVQYGLISPDDYLNIIREKLFTSDQFRNDVPFTEISRETLDTYHDQYYNVYMKGALIGMCLDLTLLKHSNGTYGLVELMRDLGKTYGKDKAFKDEELFREIARLTYPEISQFFDKYVQGTEPLPIAEVLALAGVQYEAEAKISNYSLGIISENLGVVEFNGKPRLQLANVNNLNEMGLALGFQQGDILEQINDKTLPDLGPSLGQFIQKEMEALPTLPTLSYTVLRQVNGKSEQVKLSAPVKKIDVVVPHQLSFLETATPEQMALRKAWLKAN